MGSGPSINYPSTPSYGEGMAEALRAQTELLRGVGDFADIGSLESLLPLEENIRMKTAQTDTDVLRQTLLGDGTFETFANDGRVITGYEEEPEPGTYTIEQDVKPFYGHTDQNGWHDHYNITTKVIDTATGKIIEESKYVDDNTNPTNPQFGSLTESKALAREQAKKEFKVIKPQQIEKVFSADRPDSLLLTAEGQVQERKPIYKQNPDGTEFVAEAGTFKAGDVARKGTGMVDLLGDTRAVQEFETKTATAEDVAQGLAEEVGDQFVAPVVTQRQAGFDDKGNFQGLSVLAEDIQRGNLSRQREADLQDVSRLSGLYQGIMEDYKPGTASAMQGAKDLIEEQKDNLLKDVGISDPAQVASQGVQADPLRQNLMLQANEALGQGLTDREERQIAEAARARSTLMGRTFDQSGAIAEAEARVLEDNQRKMQNRGFAQSVLGQEAGIQTADDTRRMGADQFNVGTKMDAERLRESLRQQGLLGYLDAASRISQIENQDQLDPFQAILGRGGGTALQQGQQVFGQAGYGLNSGPQYLNPEAGLGFIQNQATNAANMYGAQQAAAANRSAGIFGGLGALGGGIASGFCWVAREVYGVHNPAWLLFREWMLNESPGWFRATYIKFGERFAKFISNKPRLKARIRLWMDSKIGGK